MVSTKALAIGAGALLVGGGAVALAVHHKRKSTKKGTKRKSKSKARNKTRRSYSNHRKKGRYTPHTAGKRPDTSRRRIRYTKNGQPYVIQYRNINGKRRKMARFISKKSAKSSRKRAGGRY